MKRPTRIVLASQSQQRREILTEFGIEFEVVVPNVDEEVDGAPERLVVENSLRKVRAVASQINDADAIVIGSDTVVVLDERVLGKPRDAAEAREFLAGLAGSDRHRVVSGIAIAGPASTERSGYDETSVLFRALSDDAVDDYVATGEWRGRSGGYAIQKGAASLVKRIDGDQYNVIGLPVNVLRRLAPELFV